KSTRRAGDAEAEQDPPIDVPAKDPEPECRAHEMRDRDRRDGQFGSGLDRERRCHEAADPEPGDGRDTCGDETDEREQRRERRLTHDAMPACTVHSTERLLTPV